MIISHDGRFVIATPTKTGTHSMEQITKQFRDSRLDIVRPKLHRMCLPAEADEYSAYLVVRNPWSRWVSIWEYLRAPAQYTAWGHEEAKSKDFATWLNWIVLQREENAAKRPDISEQKAYRSPWIWTDTQLESYGYLTLNAGGVDGLIRLENLIPDLDRVMGRADALVYTKPSHANRNHHKVYGHYIEAWSDEARKIAREKLRINQECHVFGY